MTIRLIIISILVALTQSVTAQEDSQPWQCASLKYKLAGKQTIADPAEENYDVKYVKFNLDVTNLSKVISGDVTTKAMTTVFSFSAYVFELDSVMTIDSVLFNGVSLPFITTGSLRTVALATALPANTLFTAQVFYNGIPTSSGTIFGGVGGFNNTTSPTWGTKVTFTQSEAYHAFEWWPCKQSLHDKIDSVDMWITVTNNLKAGSNGVLKAVTTIDTGHVRYEWKERFPIDYYLISLSVAPYVDYSYYMHYTGSTDSTLVQNYVYNNPATLPYFKHVIDSTGMMMDYLSTLYGRYPFWQEKYGHCMAPLGGGMEHQTMTTLGFFEGSVVAHELGHQWFGDNVTCGTWADIFMNEGFASYTEDLFIDHFRSHAKALADMQSKQADVKSVDTGTVYVDDTTSEARIFDSRLSYNKGACLLHMLRSVVNNDSAFFQVYKTYQVQMKDSTGTIADFRNAAESLLGVTVNGINLDTFFNQWAYLQGYPVYDVIWNQVGNVVFVKFVQAGKVPASVPFFSLPVELQLHSAAADTIVRVNNDQPSQIYQFTWNEAMTGMVFDPNYWLVYNMNSLSRDTTFEVGVQQITLPSITITPNPAAASWHISSLPAGSTLALSDMSGRELLRSNNCGVNADVPAGNLAPGLYLLRVNNAGEGSRVYKLIRE